MVRAFLLLVALVVPAASLRGAWKNKGASEMLTDMRPEVVSKLLSQVVHRWTQDSVKVQRSEADANATYAGMEKSCMKIAKSVIAGSDGDEDRVAEYMKDVCAAGSQEAEMCKSFASGLEDAMIGDSNYNREKLSLPSFCKSFWAGPVQAEAKVQKDKLDAEEKVAAEKAAADKKAAEEKAAADKKAAEEKAAADKKAAEEKKAADEKAAAEKAASDNKAAQEAAEGKRAAAVVEAGQAKEKAENTTAVIEKESDDEVAKISSAEDDASKLAEHARMALKVAGQKEVKLAQEAKEKAEAEARARQEKEAAAAAAAAAAAKAKANSTATANKTDSNATVAQTVATDLVKDEAAAKAAGDAKAEAIVEKVEAKAHKPLNQTAKKA